MKLSGTIRQQLFPWVLILGIWALLVLAFAGQLVFASGMPWEAALRVSLRDWVPWVLLAPATAWLTSAFPLEKESLHLSIPVHLVACMIAVLLCDLIVRSLPETVLGPPPGARFAPGPLGEGSGRPPFRRPEDPRLGPGSPLDGGPLPAAPPEVRRGWQTGGLIIRARFNIPVYWVIVSIVHALTYYRRSREREVREKELQSRLTEAKLQTLRMQLHPHFLFNTLNAISLLVHKSPQAADEMIANLSELLRATLDTSDQEIPLETELGFLDRYLEIQQARFGERLSVEKEVQPESLRLLVPTLILQPIVENAIRHGIEPRTGQGVLKVMSRVVGPKLVLTVQDNGNGTTNQSGGSPGIGLANTRARIEALYGLDGQLRLSSSPSGFTAELILPSHDHSSTSRG